ncbi:hypothetical protein KCU89_g118, partial [Aureobasidium melanogenum]
MSLPRIVLLRITVVTDASDYQTISTDQSWQLWIWSPGTTLLLFARSVFAIPSVGVHKIGCTYTKADLLDQFDIVSR